MAAVDNGIDYWRRHLPHDHPAALLAPASAPSTPLHTPTALPAFPSLPPVGLAQAPTLPIPEICGSLANEIAQLRHEIDDRPVLEGWDGLLRRTALEPAQPEREGSRHARAREVHRASSTAPRRRVRDARGVSSGEDVGAQKAQESEGVHRGIPLCFLVLHLGLVIQAITLDHSIMIIAAPHEHSLHLQHAVHARAALLLLLPGRGSFQALSGFHPRDMVGIDRQRLDADCALPVPGLGLALRPKLLVDGPPAHQRAGAHHSPKLFAL